MTNQMVKHERRYVGHTSGWQEPMDTCVCGQKWPCTGEQPSSKAMTTSEIASRLRNVANLDRSASPLLTRLAADEIERLQKLVDHDNEMLRERNSRVALLESLVNRTAHEPPALNIAPIARIVVEGGSVIGAALLAPGLPDGAHELFPVPLDPNGEMQRWEVVLGDFEGVTAQPPGEDEFPADAKRFRHYHKHGNTIVHPSFCTSIADWRLQIDMHMADSASTKEGEHG